MKSSICHTFTGFQRCTKIPINTDSLRVPRSVRPSLYPFYSQNLLTHIKQGLQKYCETAYSRSRVQSDVDPKEFKRIIRTSSISKFQPYHSIKSFDFSTLYTTIPQPKLKSRLATIIRNSFIHKNGNRRYKFLVLGREGPYFVKEHSDSKTSTLKMTSLTC